MICAGTLPSAKLSASPATVAIPAPCDHRRGFGAGAISGFLASAIVASHGWVAPPALAAEVTPYQTPYTQGFNLKYGLSDDGRIRKCDGAVQPNCVSTSSLSNLFSPPWLSGEPQPERAAELVAAAMQHLHPENVEKEEELVLPSGGVYQRFRVPSAFEYDIIEVLIAPQAAPYDQDPPLVTYRMQAGTVKYIWPLTQPVTDMGAQRKRAVALRQWLGWRINAGSCSSIECYSD